MSRMFRVKVTVKDADDNSETLHYFYIKMQTNDNQNDYLKDFLNELKLRTYRMPDAKILGIYWFDKNYFVEILCSEDLQNAFELTASNVLEISVDLRSSSASDFGGPDFDVDSVCTKCGKAVECGTNQSSFVVAVSDLAESLQLVTFEVDKISQLATSASVQLRTVNNAVILTSNKAHTVD